MSVRMTEIFQEKEESGRANAHPGGALSFWMGGMPALGKDHEPRSPPVARGGRTKGEAGVLFASVALLRWTGECAPVDAVSRISS